MYIYHIHIFTFDLKLLTMSSRVLKILFNKTSVWVKKDNPDFDVTMGSYDGAEVYELVGLYLLNLLSNEFKKQKIVFGLHRDDGLSCFQNIRIQRK